MLSWNRKELSLFKMAMSSDLKTSSFYRLWDNVVAQGKLNGGGGVNQAYSRLSITHGHITDCKLDSVVYAGTCVVIF